MCGAVGGGTELVGMNSDDGSPGAGTGDNVVGGIEPAGTASEIGEIGTWDEQELHGKINDIEDDNGKRLDLARWCRTLEEGCPRQLCQVVMLALTLTSTHGFEV